MGISDFFYLAIFLSVIGSIACILLLFVEKVMRAGLPFLLYLSIVFFFSVPLAMPDATLFYHDPTRIEAFKTAAIVWIIGLGISVSFILVRVFAAHMAIKKYAGCTTERVRAVYDECLGKIKLRHTPTILYGKIKEPACVITTWRSYVVLREEIIKDLTDDELKTVLTHELLHIKRKHTVLQKVFDFICSIHWFNPIVWIGRHEFSSACEIDCDRSVLRVFGEEIQAIAYAKVMVKLMELAAVRRKSLRGTLGALDFWAAKHRISNLLNKPSKLRKAFSVFACAVIICGTAWLSADFSRSYFYPYNGTNNGTEWSETE